MWISLSSIREFWNSKLLTILAKHSPFTAQNRHLTTTNQFWLNIESHLLVDIIQATRTTLTELTYEQWLNNNAPYLKPILTNYTFSLSLSLKTCNSKALNSSDTLDLRNQHYQATFLKKPSKYLQRHKYRAKESKSKALGINSKPVRSLKRLQKHSAMTIPLELQFDSVNSLFNLRAMQGKIENTGHVIHRPKCPSQWEKKTHTKPQNTMIF